MSFSHSHASVFGAAMAAVALATLSFDVRAQSCPVRSYGPTCGANAKGNYAITPKGREISLDFSASPMASVGLLVFGANPASLRLPGGTCTLLTSPLVVFPAGITNGAFGLPFVLPSDTALAQTYVQLAAFRSSSAGLRIDTSNALVLGPWLGVQSLVEDFSTTDRIDDGATTMIVDGGEAALPFLADANLLGDFDARFGGKDTGKKDGAGRQIYEWNTDLIVIPASRSKSGKDVRVTDGVLKFRNFVLPQNIRVRFVGKHIARIFATGKIDIAGVLDASGSDSVRTEGARGRPNTVGQAPRAGGPGGGAGGRGGDNPHIRNPKVDGATGESPTIQGHVHQAALAQRGGTGSLAFPRPVKDSSVRYSAFSSVICQTTASGGAGANFLGFGGGGRTLDNRRGNETPQSYDFGPRTSANQFTTPKYYARTTSKMKSIDYYLIPGAGGGGGGTHPMTAYDAAGFEPVNWSAGLAGAGGGGAVALVTNGALRIQKGAEILARGGDALTYGVDKTNFNNPAPGGAGSGGSIVMQSIASPVLEGLASIRGGKGGLYQSYTYTLRVDSESGLGADGLLRVESPVMPDFSKFGVAPRPRAEMRGPLKRAEITQVGVLASKWIDVGRFPEAWHHAIIRARVGSSRVTFPDNPDFGAPGVRQVTSFEYQGVRLDAQGKVIGKPSAWTEKLREIQSSSANSVNGVRFRLRIDVSKLPTVTPVRIDEIALFFDC